MRKFLLLILFFTFSWSQAQTRSDSFRENLATLNANLRDMELTEPTPELLQFSWLKIQGFLKKRNDFIFPSKSLMQSTNQNYLIDSSFSQLLELTFRRLLQQRKIKYINAKLWDNFQLQNFICDPKYLTQHQVERSQCRNLRAFYVHLNDTIFLREDLSNEDFAKALFHELIHAYQMAYRLPLDLSLIHHFVEQKRLDPERAWELLSFSYEAQANWYEIVGSEEPAWMKLASSPTRAEKLAKNVAEAFIEIVKIPVYAGKALATGLQRRSLPGEEDLLAKLPYVEFSELDYGFNYSPGVKTALTLRDPVILKQTDMGLAGQLDLSFHKTFSKSLERVYYGELPFLFQNNAEDQKLFKELTDQMYHNLYIGNEMDLKKRFGENHPLTKYFRSGHSVFDSSCQNIIDQISQADSPFIFWTTLSPKQVESCPTYQGTLGPGLQTFLDVFLSQTKKNPFLLNGTEGGGGGFQLSPSQLFLPQLELLPVREDGVK